MTHHSLHRQHWTRFLPHTAAAIAAGTVQYLAQPMKRTVSVSSNPSRSVRRRLKARPKKLLIVPRASKQRTELKTFDFNTVASNFQNTGQFSVLNAMTQGPEFYQRIGRKIYMRSIEIRGYVSNVATGITDFGRIMLIYDSQTNGGTPPLAALLQSANTGAITDAFTGINMNNRQRFTVLRDIPLIIPPVTNTGGAGVLTNGPQFIGDGNNPFNIHLYIPLKGIETIFNSNDAGNTTADITSGSLLLVTYNQNAVNNGSWVFNFQSRLRFFD